MKVIGLVTENFAELYGITDKTKRRQFVKEQIGRFRIFEKTDYFFATNHIEELDSLSKKDQNILADVLSNTPHKAEIIKAYNENILNGNKLEDKTELFKQLNTICQFLKAHPYNEPAFGMEVCKRVVHWGFAKNKNDIELLKKSFNLYVDKNTINNFLDSDEEIKLVAREQITQTEQIYQKKEKNDTICTGAAGLVVLGLAGGLKNEMTELAVNITGIVGKYHHLTPTIESVVTVAAAATILYTVWKTVNNSFHKYISNNRNDSIGYSPVKVYESEKPMQHMLAQRIFKEVLHDTNFKETDSHNKKYIGLCVFLNEKVSFPTMTISNKAKADLGLSAQQVKKLNDLDIDRIHEITNVQHPKIRTMLLLDNFSPVQESLLKEIANANILLDSKNKTGEYLKNIPIINMSTNLENKIKSQSPEMKEVINVYLNTFTNGTGKCDINIMESLETSLNKGNNIIVAMHAGIKSKMVNLDLEAKNKELDYVKKVGGWINGNEAIMSVNEKVRDLIVEQANDMNCVCYTRYLNTNPTVGEKVQNTTISALQKIGKLRDATKKMVGITVPTI